jgi:hypothetical protein
MENPQGRAIKKDSDMYKALDTLAEQVKIVGIFSDWPATVTTPTAWGWSRASCRRWEPGSG